MVPRWRSLGLTPGAELTSARRTQITRASLIEAEQPAAEWATEKTPWTAADVLSAAVLTGQTGVADAAAAFLETYDGPIAAGVRRLLTSYRAPTASPSALLPLPGQHGDPTPSHNGIEGLHSRLPKKRDPSC